MSREMSGDLRSRMGAKPGAFKAEVRYLFITPSARMGGKPGAFSAEVADDLR